MLGIWHSQQFPHFGSDGEHTDNVLLCICCLSWNLLLLRSHIFSSSAPSTGDVWADPQRPATSVCQEGEERPAPHGPRQAEKGRPLGSACGTRNQKLLLTAMAGRKNVDLCCDLIDCSASKCEIYKLNDLKMSNVDNNKLHLTGLPLWSVWPKAEMMFWLIKNHKLVHLLELFFNHLTGVKPVEGK